MIERKKHHRSARPNKGDEDCSLSNFRRILQEEDIYKKQNQNCNKSIS